MKHGFKVNNFDLIRLIAALQVAITHAVSHLSIDYSHSIIMTTLKLFPGVPIFFFVSGFLISKSYENNSILNEYAQNRILRIYPALFVCTFITVISVYFSGYFSTIKVDFIKLLIWILSQISIVQSYSPAFMSEYGTHHLNGSLWTISVELQFYILIPILYWILRLVKPNAVNKYILVFIFLFMITHEIFYSLLDKYGATYVFKLWRISFSPWIYMFLVGVFFQKNFSKLYHLLSNKVLYVLFCYLILSYFLADYFRWRMGNGINPVLFFFLATLVFSFAYSYPTLSKKFLRGNDISYGVYIYHTPIHNLLIFYGLISNILYVYMALAATLFIATASWVFIEKPSLKLKKHPLNPLK